jgi:cytidyltransferase-like protein
MKKIGVFVARMQPVHLAHLYVIEKALEENDIVYIFIGSANKKGTIRNPFAVNIRKALLNHALHEKMGADKLERIQIVELADWSTENDLTNQKEWGRYLYYNIVSKTNSQSFKLYYSDEPQIMLDWFEEDIKKRIMFRFLERSSIYEGLSATKIRKALLEDDEEYLKRFCPRVIPGEADILKRLLKETYENPKEDYGM